MANILREFREVSGHKANNLKSSIFVSKSTVTQVEQDISNKFNIPLMADLGKYLGIPILHDRAAKGVFELIVSKVRKRLSGWKSKIFSKAAPSILIQAVTSAIPYYTMNVIKLPSSIIEELERWNRRFFWGQTEQHKKLHTLAWELICRPKTKGVGLKNLQFMYKSLLAKLCWRMMVKTNQSTLG